MGLDLKINPRTDTDVLAMQYHKRAAIYRQRYNQTELLDTTDTAEHRRSGRYRTAAFSRDWKNLDATKQAAKRPNEPFVCRRHGAFFCVLHLGVAPRGGSHIRQTTFPQLTGA